jgi:alanyl-tRNA synthetase
MTQRLYYDDCYLRDFRARVIDSADGGRKIYLDRSAFYPTSGGQPFDLGAIGGVAVREVIDEEDRVAHILDAPLAATEVDAKIDWARRYDHMQQHTGQHLLSAVLVELYDVPTVSFHMGALSSTIDLGTGKLDSAQIERVEERCAEIVAEARPVSISYEDSQADLGLRKPSARSGTLRIISIDRLDRSACGGTHVRSTAELGPVLIRKMERMRGNVRIEFVCGMRAVRRARQDFQLLSEISRIVSVPFEETPALVAAQTEKAKSLEKTAARLAAELAKREGAELYASTAPDPAGIRKVTQRGPIDDAMRARAQAFVAGSKAVFLAVSDNPPSLLLAASADSGIHAGDRVKAAVTSAGGRGGGNQALAQGSVPTPEALEKILAQLTASS